MVKRLEMVGSGLLYANPYPADWAIHGYFSRIVEIRSGELLCVYRRASAMYGDDGRSWVLRSLDGGASWNDEGCLYDGSDDDRPYSYSATSMTRMGDGEIVVIGFRFHRPSPNTPMYDAETGGHLMEQPLLFRSGDDGRTWVGPQLLEKPDEHIIYYDSITELTDGRWFVACDWDRTYDEYDGLPSHVSGLFSDDRGKTWGDRVQLTGGPSTEKAFRHTRVTKLADGRLIAFPWAGSADGSEFHTLHRIEGSPDARQWKPPQPTTLLAQTNRPADMGDGHVALIMSVRESDQPGIYVALSDDEGVTWDTNHWVQVWDAYGRDSLGVPRTDKYPAAHDTISFGAPDAICLSDGDIMASFWASQRGQMVVRWARLRMV